MNDQKRTYKRRRKLIQPGLQLRLTAAFVGVIVLTVMLEAILVSSTLSAVAAQLPNGGREFYSLVPGLVTRILVLSLLVFVPLTVAVGVLVTFRIAGPVYRFEQFLAAVAAGTQVGPCKLREGDELKSLCDAINLATEPVRRRAGGSDAAPADEDSLQKAG